MYHKCYLEFDIITLIDNNKKESSSQQYVPGKRQLASTFDRIVQTKNNYADSITFGKKP